MKVILNIAEDKELRDSVNELIKGQFLAMTREMVQAIIKDEIERLVKADSFRSLINDNIRLRMPKGRELNRLIKEYIGTEQQIHFEAYARKVFMDEYKDVTKRIIETTNVVVDNKIKNISVSVK